MSLQYLTMCKLLKLATALLVLLFSSSALANPAVRDYQIKAAIMYKISKFVTWPEPIGNGQVVHFGLCILGDDKFGSTLDELETRTTNNKPIRVFRFSQSSAVNEQCHLVFIAESKAIFLDSILDYLAPMPILTISDIVGFVEKGGMLQIVTGDQGIQFFINLNRLNQSGLSVSAQLLELSTIVNTEPRY